MRHGLAVRAVSLIVIIFLPVTLLGLMLSVNEYRDQGIGGGVDCDGPLSVMIVMAPSLAAYTGGAAYYGVRLMGRGRSKPAAALMVLCLVMLSVAGGKAWTAYGEKSRPEYQETCGGGR